MQHSKSIVVSLISVIFITFSRANSASLEENFIQCLSNQSQSSNPISDAIFTSTNASFGRVLELYIRNLRFAGPTIPKPIVIVTAKHESHVQAAVICSKKLGLQLRLRSGGHDYEGLSSVSSVPFAILDMFNLRSINISLADESAWVEAGATIGEVYYRIAEASKIHAFPAGVCGTVGVGGHFSGGGYGNLMRKFGLSVDNIIDATIVDVQGRILDRNSMGEDLFWAIRGGGAASFGVILSWKIKLVRVPETVTVFRVKKTLEQGATDLVSKWQEVAADKLDDDLFIRLVIDIIDGSKKGEKTIQVSFLAQFLGQAERLLSLMNQSFPELGLQKEDCFEVRWIDSTLFWINLPIGTPVEALLERTNWHIFLKGKSDYVQKSIPKAGLESIWKLMIELGDIQMLWSPYGGKMSRIPETETPFPHRAGNIFKIHYSANWGPPAGIEINSRFVNTARTFFEAMTPHVSKNPREAFLNYRDLDIGINVNDTYEEGKIYGIKYFKNNFDRLVLVKTNVDPDNFFKYEQSIPIRSY